MTTLECFTARQQQYFAIFLQIYPYGVFHHDGELFLLCDLRRILLNSLKYIEPLHTGRVFALITVTLLRS